jgi:hypothetical protein
MGEATAAINGQALVECRITVGNVGPWHAICDFAEAPDVDGAVTLTIGDSFTAKCTVDASAAGSFGLQRRVRVVGGANGWGKAVAPKSYQNDAGIKGRTVAEDAARTVGETIGTFVPAAEKFGRAYARQAGPASLALEDVLGGVAWWVGFDGVTNAGPRPATALDASAYELLAYDPRDRVATLGVDDVGAVSIGSILTDRLDAPATVRALEITVSGSELRVLAHCNGAETARGPLAELFRTITRRAVADRLWGVYRYRVVRMAVDRVELQAVRKVAGLPDLLPVSMWPGVAGAVLELAPSAEVLVQFVEGDRAQPIITGFAGQDASGFVPVQLTLGGKEGAPVARQGDAVEVLLPPAVFTGTISGAPASGVLAFPVMKTSGIITAGSSKVKAAT